MQHVALRSAIVGPSARSQPVRGVGVLGGAAMAVGGVGCGIAQARLGGFGGPFAVLLVDLIGKISAVKH